MKPTTRPFLIPVTVLLVLALSGAIAEAAPDNGWVPTYHSATITAKSTATLVPGSGWHPTDQSPPAFFWYGDGIVFNSEGPFEFTAPYPVTLRITDDYCTGDRFRVYDNGIEIGETTRVARSAGWPAGPEAAFSDMAYSRGIFSLGPGDHSIVIQIIENPFGMGKGYLRVDQEYALSSLDLTDLGTTIGLTHDSDQFQFTAAVTPSADSDGIDVFTEELVVSYGHHVEVIPPFSFDCKGDTCVYAAAGPGITWAIVTGDQVSFRARGVDMCPGRNPMRVGFWIGNDGGEVKPRCSGMLRYP